MNWSWLHDKPLLVAIAGPNGAGKTTFYYTHVAQSGLCLVNADRLAKEMLVDAYTAASMANQIRREFVDQRESFVFETDFSDPVGDKLEFLESCTASGYTTALLFVGLNSPSLSAERVAMRVSQGGHDVPLDKLKSRFPRTVANLKASIKRLPHVVAYDNSDLTDPCRQLAVFENGIVVDMAKPTPKWLIDLLGA